MDDSLLVRVLHRVTDFNKHFQASSRLERILVAVIGDLDAANQFHYEIWPSAFGGAGVEHTSDVRMIHQGQCLSFGLETGNDRLRVHAGFDYFDRHLPTNWFLLFGHENDTATALTDLLQQLVTTHTITRFFTRHPSLSFDFSRSLFEKFAGLHVSLQKSLDTGPQIGVSSTGRFEESGALFSRKLHCFREQIHFTFF